jgi:hypothetical protein
MSVQTHLSSSPDAQETVMIFRFLEDVILRARPGVNGAPKERADLVPAIWTKLSLGADEARSDPDFLRTVRENLHAASRHVELGHEARTFRECSRPMCRDARNLIPSLEIETAATDDELEAIFERALARCFS